MSEQLTDMGNKILAETSVRSGAPTPTTAPESVTANGEEGNRSDAVEPGTPNGNVDEPKTVSQTQSIRA